MKAYLVPVAALSVFFWQMPTPLAPKSALSKAPQAPRAAKKRPSNVVRASILKKEGVSLTLHIGGGIEVVRLAEKTHYWIKRQPSTLDAFAIGQTVMARLRRTRGEPQRSVVDLADIPSWRWLQHIRRDVTRGVLTSADENQLQITLPDAPSPLIYKVSDRTLWGFKEAELPANPFHPGDTVWVVPHVLASGDLQAQAVADTQHLAALLKERLASTVRGKVLSVDPAAHTFVLQTLSGDQRTLPLPDQETASATQTSLRSHLKSRLPSLTLATLHAGMLVSVHISHKRDGTAVVRSVTPLIQKTHRKR